MAKKENNKYIEWIMNNILLIACIMVIIYFYYQTQNNKLTESIVQSGGEYINIDNISNILKKF